MPVNPKDEPDKILNAAEFAAECQAMGYPPGFTRPEDVLTTGAQPKMEHDKTPVITITREDMATMRMTYDMPIKCDFAPRADTDEWAEARHRVMLVRDSLRRTIELRIVPPGMTYAGFVVAIERLPSDQ